jgi:hypothetical protein
MTKTGWLLPGMALVGLASGAAAQQAAVTPAATTADFCARLAADSGIDRPPGTGAPTQWTVNALNLGQRVLFGGSAATGVGVTPVEPATAEDYQRIEDMCLPDGKGAICRLVGPVKFKFIWKGRKIVTAMGPGERATVSVVSTRTTCRTEAGS